MLIIEGADCTGKTTLCKKLLEHLPTHVYSHFTRLPAGFDYYWGYADRISRNVVQDRFHMSEPVYSKVRGEKESPLTPELYRLVDAALRRVGAFTVVLIGSDNLIHDRSSQKPEMYSPYQIVEANRYFKEMANHEHGLGTQYRPDVDQITYLNLQVPYVTDTQVAAILEAYRARQQAIDRVLQRRAPAL